MQSLIVLGLMSLAGVFLLALAAMAVGYGAGLGWTRGVKRAEGNTAPTLPEEQRLSGVTGFRRAAAAAAMARQGRNRPGAAERTAPGSPDERDTGEAATAEHG